MKTIIQTSEAPAAIGNYSQAIQVGNVIYFSGQIPLDPKTGKLVEGDITKQATQVFANLKAVAEAANGTLDAVVKLTVYLTDLNHLPVLNDVMAKFFQKPYPARTSIGVAALPKEAVVEVDAVMVLFN